MALGTQVNTLASNGLNGTWKIAADKIDVRPSAVSDGVTVHADTLSRNLASTNIELVSTKGDLDLDGSVSWASGNRLGLGSAADLTLNGRLNASGAKAGLELKAEGAIDINDKIVLGGAGSALAMDAGEGHRVNGTASVSWPGPTRPTSPVAITTRWCRTWRSCRRSTRTWTACTCSAAISWAAAITARHCSPSAGRRRLQRHPGRSRQ